MTTTGETTAVEVLERASAGEWLAWTRMADFRDAAPPILVGGEGPYVFEADGTRLFDGVSGLFTTQIGYSHGAELGLAAQHQLEHLGFYPNWAATSPAPVELTRRVVELAPENLTRVFFTSGGSEAVESALKLVRQHWLARGEPLRRKIVARRGAYHGCTLGALSLTGIPAARAPFEPLLGDVRHAENTDRRHYPYAADGEAWARASAAAVERTIIAEGAHTVAGVVVEPVRNAGGCLAPPPGYAARLREICDRHGVLLWCDEVITGFGRLGAWFGSQLLGFDADIITFAKGVTSGQAPLGGVLFSEEVAEPVVEAGAVYVHGFTFGGHPLSCAVALANLDIMERLDVLGNVRANAARLGELLEGVAAGSPLAVEARGYGFFRALELRDAAVLPAARAAIRRAGVIVRLDDRVNPCLAISPPLISTGDQLEELAGAIAEGLAEASSSAAG
ncbi:MAG: aminotransferase class III-fold pyridoxal phosphate-dependent enzyme [Gaiellales bacterium]